MMRYNGCTRDQAEHSHRRVAARRRELESHMQQHEGAKVKRVGAWRSAAVIGGRCGNSWCRGRMRTEGRLRVVKLKTAETGEAEAEDGADAKNMQDCETLDESTPAQHQRGGGAVQEEKRCMLVRCAAVFACG